MFTPRRMPTDAIDTSRSLMCNMGCSRRALKRFPGDIFAYFYVAQDNRRQPIRNDAAFVESKYTLCVAVNDFHIMFDEQHRDFLCTHGFHYHIHQAELLIC